MVDGLLRTALLALVLCASAATASAQQRIELHGRGDAENDAFLRSVLRRSDLIVIRNDTLIARNDTLRGTVLVLVPTTSARIDGAVVGDVVVVDGNLFLRPTARVSGRVYNIGGGYYPSELAVVTGGTRTQPNAPYEAEARDDGVLIIRGTSRRSALVLDGVYGFTPPTYDRVDGLTPRFGAGLVLPRIGLIEPSIRGHVQYHSLRENIVGGGELALTRRRTEIAGGWERSTLTNERWIRGDLMNSLGFLVQGKDYHDYYEAERAYVELRRTLEDGPRLTKAFLRGQVEDATSLRPGNPWTLMGTPRVNNLAVDDGRITSAIAGMSVEWTHPSHVVELAGSVELARAMFDSNHEFAGFVVNGEWAMPALSDHSLEFDLHFQGPLPGTDSLPRQRWSFIGGSGTLNTFALAEFRGDRVAFVETQYSIPLPNRFRMRLLGLPTIDLLHKTGMAWNHDESMRFRQNVGIRLRYNVVYVRAVTDPEDFGGKIELAAGVSMPRKAFPWQTPR